MLNDYLTLGRSGLRVSPLCMGTMTFGNGDGWTCDAATSTALIRSFLDAGGNFIDTADVYTGGESERIVGRTLNEAGLREQVVLATKYTFSSGAPGINALGNGRKNAVRALDDSLRRLGTDYVDLYWMHAWDTITPIEEVVQTFDAMIRAGKIRYYGLSDVPAWYAALVCAYAAANGMAAPIALQLEYSLVERVIEREHLPAAAHLGLGLCPWGPLASGALTGKYKRGGDSQGRLQGEKGQFRYPNEERLAVVDSVIEVAEGLGRSPAEVALNWAATRFPSTSVIIGARTAEQLETNLASLDLDLDDAVVARLDAATRLRPRMPYGMFAPQMRTTMLGNVRGWK